jgi:predicted dehydrogenase
MSGRAERDVQKRSTIPGPPVRVGLVGCGYWGPNLIRNLNACPATELAAVCDRDARRLQHARDLAPQARACADFEAVLADDSVEAVAIATPPRTHGPLGKAALLAGKHVLIEKPMATSLAEAEELLRLADAAGRTLMVDHTFLYSPAVRRIKQLLESGELGEIYYFDSVRINLGLFQSDVNVLWDLAVHDLSIVDYLLGRAPATVSAFGSSHTSIGLEDVAYLTLDFGDRLLASFHVNWLSPVKIRHLIIGGSRKGLVYNDLDRSEPLKIYDRGITLSAEPEARIGALVSYRTGDVWSPHVEREEPLANVVKHFAHCVRTGTRPLTDGLTGLRIVTILDLAQRSVQAHGSRLAFNTASEAPVLPLRPAA